MTVLYNIRRADITKTDKLGELTYSDLKRIISNVEINLENINDLNILKKQCWIWTGHIQDNNKGHCHPSIHYMNKRVLVHRLMYHNYINNVPKYERKSDALQVNHKCGHEQNGKCVNPWHMYLGTPKDNMQDALREGTKYKAPRGEKNLRAKLSDKQVQDIKNMKGNTNMSQKEIASIYNIHQSQISRWWNQVTRKSD